MKTEIITIGDELMSGDVVDHNFSWLAERLWNAGYNLHWHTTVADKPEDMSETLRRALRSDLVIVTGGLGPTSDDRTLAIAADTFGRKLVQDDAALAEIEKRLQLIIVVKNEIVFRIGYVFRNWDCDLYGSVKDQAVWLQAQHHCIFCRIES